VPSSQIECLIFMGLSSIIWDKANNCSGYAMALDRMAGRCRRMAAGAPGSVPGRVAGGDLFGLYYPEARPRSPNPEPGTPKPEALSAPVS